MAESGHQPFFRKYSQAEMVSSTSQQKSSASRAIRARLIQDYPAIEEIIDELMPKKSPTVTAKCANHLTLLLGPDGEVIFFQHRDGAWFPSLRLCHKFPALGRRWQVDKGAIKHVLGGSNVFCGGLVSGGGEMKDDLGPGSPVVLYAEGKEHAVAVGLVKMSCDDIRASPKGVAVETLHFLGDGLFMEPKVK